MMNYDLLNKIADAGTDSKFWGTAVQEKALDILGILTSRSWQDDEFQADRMLDWAEYEYLEFLRLLSAANKCKGV